MVGVPGLKRLSGLGGAQGPRHTDRSGYKVWNGLVVCNVVEHQTTRSGVQFQAKPTQRAI